MASTRGRTGDWPPVSDQPHHPFPWRVTAIVAIVVAVASVLAGMLLSRDRVESTPPPASSAPSASTSPLPPAQQRQVTMLLTVRDADRTAVSNVLIGVGGETGFVAELLLPRELLLPTVPPMRLQQVTDPTGQRTADQPLETLLGVQVDAIVDLDRLAWSGLIDATGSRVDVDIAQRPGSFPLVLDRVLLGLPAEELTIGELLTGLGSMARTTVTNEDASALIALIARELRAHEVRRSFLPVIFLRSGPDRVAIADQQATAELVAGLFPKALLQPGHQGQRRVVLQRAGATVGAAVDARLRLVAAGFGVVADRGSLVTVSTSAVYVPDDSPAALAAGADTAAALGLPAASVVVDPGPSPVVDVRVVLGSDALLTS